MAINKVVNKTTKSHGAMRNVIEYVLQDKKVKEGYVDITGPYSPDTINWDGVYRAFLEEKKLWDKDSGRMYAHNIISFHKDENITPAECLEIGRKYVDRFFPEHQSLIGVHQDKDHLHVHIVTNSVSYIDGTKLHQTKRDLEQQKKFTNTLCQERGLTIAEKGKHFDGTTIEEGEITAWRKDKYNLLINDSKKSYVAECAMAVLEAKEDCCSKDDFIRGMEEKGWHTTWTETKQHITFINANGDKVRDSNLSKTFIMDINKEALIHEFERQNEIRLAKLKTVREREQYYSKVESVIQGTGATESGISENTKLRNGNKSDETERSEKNTTAFIRELRSHERAATQKRNNSAAKRKNRDAARERHYIEAKQGTKGAELRTTTESTKHDREKQSYDWSR